MALKLARSSAEAHLYMELRPCENCGSTEFEPDSSVISAEGDLASRYAGLCENCGTPREFIFRLPEQILMPIEDEPEFGDARPSELLDPGEWVWLADLIGNSIPADPTGLSAEERRQALIDLRTVAAGVSEAIKFIPAGADAVPADAFWSERGKAMYDHEPGRFDRRRLEVVQKAYSELAGRFAA
jgi:hypothetical protein